MWPRLGLPFHLLNALSLSTQSTGSFPGWQPYSVQAKPWGWWPIKLALVFVVYDKSAWGL